MDHYLDGLGTQLQRAAAARQATTPGRATRRLALAGAAVAAVAAAGTVALLSLPSGSSTVAEAAQLAVLELPATDISARAGTLPPALRRGMDLRHARAFTTAKGTGYVLTTADGASLCLVVPDPPAGFGATCGAIETVRRDGLVAELVAPAPDAGRSQVFVVQPVDAPPPQLRDRRGGTEALPVRDGIATATIDRPGTLTVHAASGPKTHDVRPYEPQGELLLDCGDGRMVQAPPNVTVDAARFDQLCTSGRAITRGRSAGGGG